MRKAFHQPHKPGFGGCVVGLSLVSCEAYDRSDHDDPAASLFQHGAEKLLRQVEDAREIHFENFSPSRGFHVERESVLGLPCVVDENVERLVLGENGLGERSSLLGIGEVARIGLSLSAQLLLETVELGDVAPRQKTWAPRAASRRAVAEPMPPLAPVTRARLEERESMRAF